MDNENLNPTEETTEIPEEVESAFDDVFADEPVDDDDFDLSEDAGENTASDEAEPEQTEEPESQEETPEETDQAEPEKPAEAENQRFTLNYLGENKEVSRDEIIELAQKGMDYDKVKAERDSFKADSATMQRYKSQDAFLKELAEQSSMTVEELIENTKARMLMSEDDTLTEEEALEQVRANAKKEASEKKGNKKADEPSPEERRNVMFADFLQAYPDVDAKKIPQEVWDDANRTFDLTGAYTRWESRELKKELQTLRQNLKNKERSTGSRRSVGASAQKDDFDEAWDSV